MLEDTCDAGSSKETDFVDDGEDCPMRAQARTPLLVGP